MAVVAVIVSLAAACAGRPAVPSGDIDLPARKDHSGARDAVAHDVGRLLEGGGCLQGTLAGVGRLCVGASHSGTTPVTLVPGQPIPIEVYPKGCFSSSSTVVHRASCSVSSSGTGLTVDAMFCLEDTGCVGGCTPDCGGGHWAQCSFPGLSAGTYSAKLDGLEVKFTIPHTFGFGGLCDGQSP